MYQYITQNTNEDMCVRKINHGFTTNKANKKHGYCSYTMVTTNEPWFYYANCICSKTVVIQMVINTPKKHGYYTFTKIKPWLIFVRVLIVQWHSW